MTSKVDIANGALDKLGAETIASLTQDLENARIINRRYQQVLEALLREHTWNCAKTRVVLSPLSVTPEFDYTYKFKLPADCLRPLFPSDVTDWSVEKGGVLLTNDGDTLNLVYISKLDDPNDMDACFKEVFSCRLALECAEKITASTSKRQLAAEMYKEAMAVARKANAFETLPKQEDYSSWLDSRITGPGSNPMKVRRNN